MTFQAAAQEYLTESPVRSLVEGALESEAPKAANQPCIQPFGPRFEIVRMPDRDFAVFKFAKFAKETGDTWEINTCKSTTCQMIGRQPGSLDDVRPGEVNDQRIVNSWHHIMDEGQ